MTKITTIMYDFLPVHILGFFSSCLFNYRFPDCIKHYTWSTQQVIVAQHMCWFLKVSNSRVRRIPFIYYWGIVPSAPIKIGITVTFMLYSFFSSLTRSRYPYLFSLSFNVTVAFWLVNACNIKYRTNHDMRGNRDIFSGKSIYNRETISSQEHMISERL